MRTGIWLIGARGSVATTTVAGAAALRAGIAAPTGCVTALPEFAGLGLPGYDELVFGGHDVVETGLVKRAEMLTEAGVLPPGLAELVRTDLLAADAAIRPGADVPAPHTDTGRRTEFDQRGEQVATSRASTGGQTDFDRRGERADAQAETIARLVADLTEFREAHELERVVVVNVAATEPRSAPDPAHASWPLLAAALSTRSVLPASSLYACAALLADCPFVDFTPSTGARLPALDELARERGVPYAGSDGKTGETLVKSALASMFARRALRVRSWSGTNLLGGGDGATLADPDRAASKADSKAQVLGAILGHPVEGGVHIHHVPDLGEWKTAWDHIGFAGFLGVRMTMQFTWQGCDSALAAPLVLDLARLIAGVRRGGAVPELGFFFKDPVASTEHVLERQFATLLDWAARR
ncbi:inositol-3-phosphate synthase [Actinokineospora sp. 24-640]